jgi:hypothetical protein
VREGGFWGLSIDLTAFPVVSAPRPCSKTDKEVLLDGFVGAHEVRVVSGIGAEFHPCVPVFGLELVIHCCSGNCCPASVDVTSEIFLGIRGTSFQDSDCGSGKREEKWVRK